MQALKWTRPPGSHIVTFSVPPWFLAFDPALPSPAAHPDWPVREWGISYGSIAGLTHPTVDNGLPYQEPARYLPLAGHQSIDQSQMGERIGNPRKTWNLFFFLHGWNINYIPGRFILTPKVLENRPRPWVWQLSDVKKRLLLRSSKCFPRQLCELFYNFFYRTFVRI